MSVSILSGVNISHVVPIPDAAIKSPVLMYLLSLYCRDQAVNWKGTVLYFRGFRILQLGIESVKALGDFTEVILTGCSAGGLATYVHADYVRASFPESTKFHAIADAGWVYVILSTALEILFGLLTSFVGSSLMLLM